MNLEAGTPSEPSRWPTGRWWSAVALVLCLQVGLIFWLGDQGPAAAPAAAPGPQLQLAGTVTNELLALMDPSLFALPHQETFAGPAWLTLPKVGAQPFVWSEPPQWFELPVEQLGAAFQAFLETNRFAQPQILNRSEPDLSSPSPGGSLEVPSHSTYQILGGLRARSLAVPIELRSWPNGEMLTNSIVEVLVDAAGRSVSVTLLSNSGSAEADQFALRQAETARFEPLAPNPNQPANPLAGLSWGQIIFDWHTVPPPPANRPPKP